MADRNGNGSTANLLNRQHAQALASPLRSRPYWAGRTPRWILKYLRSHEAYMPMEHYSLLVNQVSESFLDIQTCVRGNHTTLPHQNINIAHSHVEGSTLDASFALYDTEPKQVQLEPIQTTLKVHSRIPSLYSNNYDQLKQQIDLATESIYETQEMLLFNHPDYGLLYNINPHFQIETHGPPTPDLLDDMLSRVWKEPTLFVMHPEALQDFRTQANDQGLTLETVEKCGTTLTAWRGIPIFPSNKLLLNPQSRKKKEGLDYEIVDRIRGQSTTNIVLMRVGEEKQGVIGLHAAKNEGTERYPQIAVDFMGINDEAIISYLLTMYVAMAVLSPDALAAAEVVV